MSNYNTLKTIINANIKQNGNQEITGQILNSVLNQMVTTLGAEYQFAGVATIGTNPGTPDAKVFYIANGKGTYTNFGGLEVTEDEVVVLYYDTAWHKVGTGIASQEKLTELEEKVNGKQDALTLTIKDNGNIVISNIQGQSKEFMPATPSGDPMHYAYAAAGAEYNDTGEDIVKTAPWADMADDDADKTVIHKAGYWYLNGLGNITNEQMRIIYSYINCYGASYDMSEAFYSANLRTNFNLYPFKGAYGIILTNATFGRSKIEVLNISSFLHSKDISYFLTSTPIKYIIGGLQIERNAKVIGAFENCPELRVISLALLGNSISFSSSSLLSIKSVLYMINNEKATSPITITLHADVYNRCMANADILAALEQHTNISLASA